MALLFHVANSCTGAIKQAQKMLEKHNISHFQTSFIKKNQSICSCHGYVFNANFDTNIKILLLPPV